MTAIFTAAEGDATNSARLLQEEGLAAQTGGGGCRSLTTIVSLQQEQHETSVSWWLAHFVQTACFAGVWISLAQLLWSMSTFSCTPMAKGQQREAASDQPSGPRAWVLPWSPMLHQAPHKCNWNQIPLGGKSLCSGLFRTTNQMLEQEQLQRNLKLAFFHSPTPLSARGI